MFLFRETIISFNVKTHGKIGDNKLNSGYFHIKVLINQSVEISRASHLKEKRDNDHILFDKLINKRIAVRY